MSETISGSYSAGITIILPTTITQAGSVSAAGVTSAVVGLSNRDALVNYGNISASELAVYLPAGGVLTNEVGGKISGLVGIEMQGQDTIVNAGIISGLGLGIDIAAGTIINQSGGQIINGIIATNSTVENSGTISKSAGDVIDMYDGGVVSNFGTASSLVAGGGLGVDINGAGGSVTNQGLIDGIALKSGGSVINQGYVALGTALYAVTISGAAGFISNTGTIVSVELSSGGSVVNGTKGIISGNYTGVNLTSGGNVTNTGTILGTGGLLGKLLPGSLGGSGVEESGSGTLENAAHALVSGTKYGIDLTGTGGNVVLTNDGTISGKEGIRDQSSMAVTIIENGIITGSNGTAIAMGSGNDLLILGSAATLIGVVVGGSGQDVVDLGSTTFSNLGSEFVNIDEIIGTAPTLALVGANTVAAGELLDNAHVLTISGSLLSHGTIENTGSILGQMWLGGTYADTIASTPAELLNRAGGIIISTSLTPVYGISGSHPVIIENAGTIINETGAYAISFSNNLVNEVILDPGSKIVGKVDGGSGGSSILILSSAATAGTISSIGSSFLNFAEISIAAGATWDISASSLRGLINSGTIILDPTTMTITGALLGDGITDIADDSELILDGSASSGATIAFSGTDGTLSLEDPSQFNAIIFGLGTTNLIDLSDLSYSNAISVSLTGGDYLDIEDGTISASIRLDPSRNYDDEYFHIASDGLNGTDISEAAVPCFLAGTNIATPAGDTAVENLRIGDMIRLVDGREKAVKWIGKRAYKAPLPNNPDIIPVVIKAGALAAGKPNTDLYLSPLHAVLVDGVLVPAGALINGISVMPCPEIQEISYYHIELEGHEAVIANGAEAETFINHASRQMFDNAQEYYHLYPHGWMETCILFAPRLESGAELERIRRKIALRAGLLLEHSRDSVVFGFLDEADRQTIRGWAYSPAQPNVPVSIDILNRGALLARTLANLPRPDVKLAGFGHGRCGFSVTLPAPLPALMRHEISVRPSGNALCLAGSPAVIDPGVAHDLLKTGGLQSLIDSAVKSLESPQDVAFLARALQAAGRQIKVNAGQPRRPRKFVAGDEKPLVLVLDEAWPTVTLDAGSNALMSHIKALQLLDYRVAFCATMGPPAGEAAFAGFEALEAMGVICNSSKEVNPELTIRKLGRQGLAAVYVHRLATASAYGILAKQHAPMAKLIFSVADLHHLRLMRQAAVTDRPDLLLKANSVKAAEFWAMRLADCVVTHSRYEAAYLRREIPQANVHVVPWAVARCGEKLARTRRHIAFIGGANHAPNVDAVTHLAQDVMPRVWEHDATIKCFIVGAGWSESRNIRQDPRLVYQGHLQDLGPLLRSVQLTVAPLRFGAGVKGKVLESLAAGVPCVITSIAAEGLPLDPHLQSVVADGPLFVDAVMRLYKDKKLNRIVSQAGLDMMETSFSEEATVQALAVALGLRGGTDRIARLAGREALTV